MTQYPPYGFAPALGTPQAHGSATMRGSDTIVLAHAVPRVDGTAALNQAFVPLSSVSQPLPSYAPVFAPQKRQAPRRVPRQHLRHTPMVWLRVGMVLLLMMFSLQGFRALVTQSVALTQVVTTDVALEQEAKLVRQKEKELERAMQHLKHPSYQERLARRVLGYVSPYEVSIQFAL